MWMCNVCAFALTICNPHVKSGHIMWFLTWLRQELKYTGPWNNLSIHQHTVIQWSINCPLRDHISIACWTQGWNKKNKKSVCKEWMNECPQCCCRFTHACHINCIYYMWSPHSHCWCTECRLNFFWIFLLCVMIRICLCLKLLVRWLIIVRTSTFLTKFWYFERRYWTENQLWHSMSRLSWQKHINDVIHLLWSSHTHTHTHVSLDRTTDCTAT